MRKRVGILIMVLIAIVSFFCIPCGQTEEKGWGKTLTLPNGQVVLDMNGEWDSLVEYQGMFRGLKSNKSIYVLTQKDSTFLAVMKIDGQWHAKGAEVLRGELSKDGFKTLEMHRVDVGWVPCKAEISENGNKIVVDDGQAVKETLTRH